MDRSELPVLILAAGASTRMRGRDKLAEPVAGEPLLRLLARRASEVGRCYIALPGLDHPRADLVADLPVTLLAVDPRDGLSASLKQANAQISAETGLLVVLGDQPDITADDMARIMQPGQPIARATTEDGKPGHPVWFDRDIRPELGNLTGDQGAKPLMSKHNVTYVALSGTRARRDLDTPEDWAAWRAETGL